VLSVDREEVEIDLEEARQRLEMTRADVSFARALLRQALGASKAPADWPAVDVSGLSVIEAAELPSAEQMHRSLRSAPDARMLELQTRMEEASVGVAKAERLPTFELRGGYSHYGIKRFDNFEDEAYVFVGIHLPLFDGLQARSAIRGARKARDVASLKYRSLLADKRTRAERVAHQAQALGRELALAERRVESSRERRRLADLDLKAQRGPVAAALGARERAVRSVEATIDLRYRRLERRAMLQRELGQLAATIRGEAGSRPPAAP
jgi:outer membrane protein TolC